MSSLLLSFLVFLAIIVIAIIVKTGWRPGNIRWKWIVGILVVGFVGWSIWWFINRPAKPKPNKSTTTTQIIRVGREKHLYLFSDFPDGIIKAEIKLGEVDFYPKGGKIKITPPLPATPWEDEPGTTMPRVKRPPGWYTIVKVNPNATGVEIWN